MYDNSAKTPDGAVLTIGENTISDAQIVYVYAATDSDNAADYRLEPYVNAGTYYVRAVLTAVNAPGSVNGLNNYKVSYNDPLFEVEKRDAKVQIALASAGESWYEARSVLEVILDGQKEIPLTITPQDPKQKRTVTVPLEGFPDRPDKTTRVRIAAGFLDEKTMVLKIADRGFGELFPKTDAFIRQEVML